MCLVNCPFGAIADKSQIYQVCQALRKNEKVIACVAPAFVGQFGKEATPAKIHAAMKVLGFYDREVSAYVSRESNVLAVVGMGVGLVLGVFLHMFIMRTVEVDMVMFGRNIKPLSFVLSAVLTVLFSMLVDLWMRRKLRGISMVESMKAPE